uniref:NADH dehydrogenase subunit 4L n=1 Tax=Paramesotriton fuzhongensis TaxID=189295 RepID=UPI0020016277|nr:NADH dehydrogenase subunit 4L [Paramesotriton fuzhongensis]YP_010598559.1 NADH dehydrogenase subunit 4L [Paramesotriton labiatus]UOU84679.1 NADH dehydrogenase subunit 4L [Paramesotriton fuzhongensis]WAK99282.1 NADH dehydrogenase subunit 4L [Paramesotriton labiatus]
MLSTLFVAMSAFALSATGLMLHRTHFLSALLCLEGMMLTMFIAMAVWTTQMNTWHHFLTPMLLLTMSACEASTGLALMVATTRTHGTDHLKNLSLLQC